MKSPLPRPGCQLRYKQQKPFLTPGEGIPLDPPISGQQEIFAKNARKIAEVLCLGDWFANGTSQSKLFSWKV